MPKNIPGYRKPSIAERLQLVEDLWDSIAEDTGADPVPPEILDEAERRVAQHRADPRSGVSWEDVKAELYRRGG